MAWQEIGASAPNTDQIFVVKPIGPGATSCTGVKPAAADPSAAPVGGFCWQQVGVERLGLDPSLNVDRTRDGVEPDIAFTGSNDSVPWVVWYEQGTGTAGLHTNEMVFAAKGVAPVPAPTGSVDGGFNWVTVGTGGQGVLDSSSTGGPCGASQSAEAGCSINKDPGADAEDPRVAAGTMTPGAPTVPWIVWDEKVGGTSQVFVARLVGAGAAARFVEANGGAPISASANQSTRADITFSGNTPYVSWRETVGGVDKALTGHFVEASNPTFVLDNAPVDITPAAAADVREPISSGCIATPFNGDGSACQGGALGTPFFLFTNGTSPRALFADAYQTDAPVTGGASGVTTSGATVSAAVNPQGSPVEASFQFGTTTAYGQATTVQRLSTANATTPFAATLSGLPAGTTIHYRAVASTDFGTVVGGDQTLTTRPSTSPPPPTPKITGLRESNAVWREGSKLATLTRAKRKRPPIGTTFSFSVNTPGRVQLAFTQTVRGRKVRGRCVAPKGSRRTPSCKRTITVGTLSFTDHTGVNRIHFEGRLSRTKKLRPGRYTLSLTASDALGRRSSAHRISFTIVSG